MEIRHYHKMNRTLHKFVVILVLLMLAGNFLHFMHACVFVFDGDCWPDGPMAAGDALPSSMKDEGMKGRSYPHTISGQYMDGPSSSSNKWHICLFVVTVY